MMFSEDVASLLRSGPMTVRYGQMSPAKFRIYMLVMLVFNPGILAVGLYRLSSWLVTQPIPGRYLALAVDRLNEFVCGVQLPSRAKLGPGLQVVHPQSVVVAPNAIAGKNLRIAGAGVTIGWADVDGNPDDHVVEIGDGVTIAAGAKVLGPIKIGDNVSIGPNVVLMEDVPAGSTVISRARAKIMQLDAASDGVTSV